jgi:prepilin-type N-terminal cleavage/methylation domain-containing protein
MKYKKNHQEESNSPSIVRSNKGFTLIELLVSIIIIGLIAAIAVPQFIKYQTRGRDAIAKTDARDYYREFVSSAMDSPDIEWNMGTKLPANYHGMAPVAGFCVYFPWEPAESSVACNAEFRHPNGGTTYVLDDHGTTSSK